MCARRFGVGVRVGACRVSAHTAPEAAVVDDANSLLTCEDRGSGDRNSPDGSVSVPDLDVLAGGGADTDNARRSGPMAVTFARRSAHLNGGGGLRRGGGGGWGGRGAP